MVDLLGAWTLESCTNFRDGEGEKAFGDPPAGQIQYTADGRMSGFLMDPAWAERGDPAAGGFTDFFAYGGTWSRAGNQVTHHVLYASHPARVGTDFVRTVTVLDGDTIELATAPETSKSGRIYVTKLVWKRCKP